VALIKLTIDNKFSPKRDMQKVVDFVGLWFMGLILGVSISGIFSNTSQKFTEYLQKFPIFTNYPFFLPSFFNISLLLILVLMIICFSPDSLVIRKQYKKMQSTMFF
jgi:hypothetical protein